MPKIMVGTDVGNYVFNPAGAGAGTIQFLQMPSGFSLDQLLVITDVTQNIILYNFADPLAGGTFNNNTQVLTLDKSSSGLLSTDVLQITSITRSIPVIHRYNISHDAQNYYMEVEPPLEGEPGKMKMLIIKGHLTLHSTLKDEEDNPKTTLHLVKFNNYAFIRKMSKKIL